MKNNQITPSLLHAHEGLRRVIDDYKTKKIEHGYAQKDDLSVSIRHENHSNFLWALHEALFHIERQIGHETMCQTVNPERHE